MNDAVAELGLVDDEAIALDQAALALAALDHPELSLDPYADALQAFADRLGEADEDERHADALARVLAREAGFAGDLRTYDDPANADLIRVIDRKRGLPVSLSILYVAAARRVGWAEDALNTPGHVLVRLGGDDAPVLVDPFNGGIRVAPDQLARLLARVVGPQAIAAEHFAPMTNRAVLVRLLMNQATRAENGGDAARALILYQRMTGIDPANRHGWWERSRLEAAGGDSAAARRSLGAMLEMTREPGLRAHIVQALDRLATPR